MFLHFAVMIPLFLLLFILFFFFFFSFRNSLRESGVSFILVFMGCSSWQHLNTRLVLCVLLAHMEFSISFIPSTH